MRIARRTSFSLLLFIGTLLFTACLQKNKNRLNVLFNNVDNLVKGSPVKLHGITIGEVINLDLLRDSELVEIKLNRGQKISIGSKFSILNQLIGNASIIVEPSEQKIFLKPIDTVKGSYETMGILDTFFADSLNKQKARQALDKIITGLRKLAEAKKDSTENK